MISFSQIKVVERTHTNVSLIGKISHTAAFQTGGLSRKLPTADALKVIVDEDIDAYKHESFKNKLRKEANGTYKSVGVRGMSWAGGEEFSKGILKLILIILNLSSCLMVSNQRNIFFFPIARQ